MTAKPYGPMAPDGSLYICLTDGAGNLVTAEAPSGAAGGGLSGTYPNPSVATNANLTGDVTSVGNATTLTNAPVIAKILTGYAKAAGTVSSADTILGAIQKLDGNDGLKQPLAGTVTNDNAAAGNIGEYYLASTAETGQAQGSATVTITIASPAVITWGTTTPFGFNGTGAAVINFTTTGALPTGIVAGTNYYVIGTSVSGNTFQIATTADNALAGTAINTSGTQSGVQTGVPTAALTTATATVVAALSVPAGDWEVNVDVGFFAAASTSITTLLATSNTAISGSARPSRQAQTTFPAYVPGVSNNILHAGPARYSLSATTTIYCVVSGTFTVSTLATWGSLRARRVR